MALHISRTRFVLIAFAAVTIAALPIALYFGYRAAHVATGFVAKNLCSGVFVSGRTPESVAADIAAYHSSLLDRVTGTVDRDRRTAAASVVGIARREAVHRDGLGCVLVIDADAAQLAAMRAPAGRADRDAPWPQGDRDALRPLASVERAVADAFAERDPDRPMRTRAMLVVHDGRIVAERYAPPIDAGTPLPGWSMAKSVVHALAGIMVKRGELAPGDRIPVREWQRFVDPRSRITLDQLLRMSSGLDFSEAYGNPLADVNVMLFAAPGAGQYAAERPLAAEAGTVWRYASGTTNIVTLAMKAALRGGRSDYDAFPRRALFDRIGMASAVMEQDATGTFVGSSFLLATARDWARFGLLYLRDGVWEGERILPEGWVRYAATPAPAAPRAQYGAGWWLRLLGRDGEPGARGPLPPDAFHAAGHGGQFVTVVPSERLVVVRLGLAVDGARWDQEAFVAAVIAALPGKSAN